MPSPSLATQPAAPKEMPEAVKSALTLLRRQEWCSSWDERLIVRIARGSAADALESFWREHSAQPVAPAPAKVTDGFTPVFHAKIARQIRMLREANRFDAVTIIRQLLAAVRVLRARAEEAKPVGITEELEHILGFVDVLVRVGRVETACYADTLILKVKLAAVRKQYAGTVTP